MLHVPLALHITFGTYGTRLHGDRRGTVDRSMNKPGDPIIGFDEQWMRTETRLLKFPAVRLTHDQRAHAESMIPAICDRGGWQLHACAAMPDHIHALLAAAVSQRDDGQAVRKWLKRWLGEELSSRWPLHGGARWFAVGGSVRWVWSQQYFENVWEYVQAQRTSVMDPRI
jgi:REP element-mobilizing transposase RayT